MVAPLRDGTPFCTLCSSFHHEPKSCGFDPLAPCILCKMPVRTLSMGGSGICPWCDCGHPEARPAEA